MSVLLTALQVPVIQAPMAGAATPALAAAVSAAGGLGSLGLGASNAEQAAAMMAATRQKLGSGYFGVNLFCHHPAKADPAREAGWLDFLSPEFARAGANTPSELHEIYPSFLNDDAMLAAVIAARPAMISFHFGLPSAGRIAALRQTGALIAASATSLPEARAIRDAGLDAIIAQGFEAGGHRGIFDPDGPDACQPSIELLRDFAHLGLPLIAAGGIMNGEDAARHLRSGAVAVQMGTAFLPCPESAASPEWRARLRLGRTVMTRAISGRPARGLENRLIALGMRPDAPPLPDYPIAYDAAKALHAAAGGSDYAAQWAGTGAARARAMPAGRLVAQLADEIEAALAA
ncbi:NAD(P)H-dependent flavin oxidoreductase [Paracoccus laeviglucosivorans]|uniref:Propionate 3-nitronate monooxygenase n=1 Tax=Paracoccus laeviglucosivorans TaxID=1197861 RepID=A0A521D5N1_9RHOB|nr:nitronate monooxygenase [Paracoccus laeviglucosivorans]SMO66998.1 nitronate monooxygenase [Paracoccus laeviglucosivorans]